MLVPGGWICSEAFSSLQGVLSVLLYPPGYGVGRNCSLVRPLLTLLPAGTNISTSLCLTNFCRTLSDFEAALSKDSTASYSGTVFPTTKIVTGFWCLSLSTRD